MIRMAFLSSRGRYAINALEEDDVLADKIIRSGRQVIKMNRGDPPAYFKTPEYIIDAYIEALKENRTGYSDATGIHELKEAVSARYKRLYGINFNPGKVTITQGVSEALLFLNSMLINSGDEAVIFRPYYTQYLPDLEFYGGKAILERYSEKDNWNVDLDGLEKSIKKSIKRKRKAKYLIITNPNNPTGTVLDLKVLKEIVELSKNYGMILVSDEIYDEIVYNGAAFTSISKIAKGVPHMILNGSSKVLDSTGFRIGYMIIPEEDKRSLEMNAEAKNLSRVRLSSNTPAQYAVAAGLRNVVAHQQAVRSMVNEIAGRVNFASRLINESKYMNTVKPSGAFYIFPKLDMKMLKIKDDKEFVDRLLEEECVQVTRGSGFGDPGHIRIVSLPPKEILETAIGRIEAFCKRHSR